MILGPDEKALGEPLLTVSDALAEWLHREEMRMAKNHAAVLALMRVQELRESVGGWDAASVGQTIQVRIPDRFKQEASDAGSQ